MKTNLPLVLAVLLILTPEALAQRTPGPGGGPRTPGGGAGARNPGSAGGNTPSQSATSSGNEPSASSGNSTANSQSSSDPQNSDMWAVAERTLNSDSWAVDSENGIFQWKDNKFDIGNNLIVRARFERYLSSPNDPSSGQNYQQLLKQIQDLLSNNTPDAATGDTNSNDRVFQAWQLLFKAKDFPEDGGASETLANQVYNAWRVRDELAQNKNDYQNLEDTVRDQQGTMAGDDSLAYGRILEVQKSGETLAPKGSSRLIPGSPSSSPTTGAQPGRTQNGGGNQTSGNSSGSGGSGSSGSSGGSSGSSGLSFSSGGTSLSGSGSDPSGGDGGNSSSTPSLPTPDLGQITAQLSPSTFAGSNGAGDIVTTGTFHAFDLARTYAKETLLDADTASMGLQVKLQYQGQLLAFIMQRRFQHSLMAGEFYEHIFKGSQQRMNVSQQQLSKFVNTDNFVPSVNSFEFVSHEAIADVDAGMKSVNAAYEAGDRWTALEQLQQTFMLGEMLPSVQAFEPAKRKVLLSLYREGNDLKHMIDLRDFAGAEQTIKKIKADAPDFQGAPILSAVQEGEQTSNLAVMAAEQAAVAGDYDKVNESLQKATELWPLNPEIKNFSKTLLDRNNLATTGGAKFDDLLARGDDRAIFDARNELGLAVFQDPDRAAKLKNILDRMGQVEMMVSYANQAMKQNNGYAAWEMLVSASNIEPNDPVVARTMADVAAHVSPFVSALDSASRAEKDGDYAASLNYYLQAQDIYPASQISHDAIDNLSKKILAQLNPNGPSAKALAKEEAAKAAQKTDSSPATTSPGTLPSVTSSSDKSASSASSTSEKALF